MNTHWYGFQLNKQSGVGNGCYRTTCQQVQRSWFQNHALRCTLARRSFLCVATTSCSSSRGSSVCRCHLRGCAWDPIRVVARCHRDCRDAWSRRTDAKTDRALLVSFLIVIAVDTAVLIDAHAFGCARAADVVRLAEGYLDNLLGSRTTVVSFLKRSPISRSKKRVSLG